jgi:hypothetical protein
LREEMTQRREERSREAVGWLTTVSLLCQWLILSKEKCGMFSISVSLCSYSLCSVYEM